MKTSELKKHIQDLKLECQETDDSILIDPIMKIFKNFDGFITLHDVYNIPILYKLIKLAIEYSETPISEREEEKKYNLVLFDSIKAEWKTFNYRVNEKDYVFHGKTNTISYITEFTDKQISEMPIEIQKAIECGFLKKVEVKQ